MILTAVVALALTQYPASVSQGQANALQQSFADAVQWRKDGGQPTFVRPGMFYAGVPLAAPGYAIRCTGYFAAGANDELAFWGVNLAGYPTGSWARYAVVQVAVSGTRDAPPTVAWANAAIPGTCSDLLPASAGDYPVAVSLAEDPASQATSTGWTAACRTGPACTYTQRLIDGTTQQVPCPVALTMAAGTWSGADVRLKPAVEWAGSDSLPPVCAAP